MFTLLIKSSLPCEYVPLVKKGVAVFLFEQTFLLVLHYEIKIHPCFLIVTVGFLQ